MVGKTRSQLKSLYVALFTNTTKLGIAFLLAVAAYTLLPLLSAKLHGLFLEPVLLILSVAFGLAFFERTLLRKEYLDQNKQAAHEVLDERADALIEQTKQAARSALSERDSLLSAADKTNLLAMFPTRREAVTEVVKDIQNAKKRIWLLGVAMAEELDFRQDLGPILKEKIDQNVDVRLLLLDPFRSPAIFRSFLEADYRDLGALIDDAESNNMLMAVKKLFEQPLYTRFETIRAMVGENTPFYYRTKFYAHNPNCWAVIADDTVYFEPYVFGGADNGSTSCIGSMLPVQKFQKSRTAVNTGVALGSFEILVDHFEKLWYTSDTDVFHMNSRDADRERIVSEVMNARLPWLKRVEWVLEQLATKNYSELAKRAHPRQTCMASPAKLTFENLSSPGSANGPAIIQDSSANGLCILVDESATPKVGDKIKLHNAVPGRNLAADFLLTTLGRRRTNEFLVKWLKPNDAGYLIGMHANS
jgi:hypothetical protein